MKKATLLVFFLFILLIQLFSQNAEMKKFYDYYKVNTADRKICDSVYTLIEKRRAAFSTEFKTYKEKYGTVYNFSYDHTVNETEILFSLKKTLPTFLRHLIYYSYFDLAYGVNGIKLNKEICQQAMKEIEPASAVWAMEPALLEAIVRDAGGENKCQKFINGLQKFNKDKSLNTYIQSTLSQERPLMVGKFLPTLKFRDFNDTTQFRHTTEFKGKFLLIDIWASWCKPCIDEFPVLLKMYSEKKEQLEFLSISIDKFAIISSTFLENKFRLPWIKGAAHKVADIMNPLKITGIPCTILVSPEGRILSYGNNLRGKNLEKTLQRLFSKAK